MHENPIRTIDTPPRSHRYDLARSDTGPLLSTLGAVMAIAFLLHGGARLGLLPRPMPCLDMDRTILLHQARQAELRDDANIILIGDSSCLMDVDAARLEEQLPGSRTVLNLGTLSYLTLDGYQQLIESNLRNRNGGPQRVVLLMHPEALRRQSSEPYFATCLSDYFARRDNTYVRGGYRALARALGLDVAEGRLLSPWFPCPLPPAYAREYGFTTDLRQVMASRNGSLYALGRFQPGPGQGNAEYALAPGLAERVAAFRACLPPGVRIAIGITPCPESFVLSNHEQRARGMLQQLAAWMRSDLPLNALPSTMPDAVFASPTHLNRQGSVLYTDALARALADQGF